MAQCIKSMEFDSNAKKIVVTLNVDDVKEGGWSEGKGEESCDISEVKETIAKIEGVDSVN